MTTSARWYPRILRREPPKAPIGVRQALAMTTRERLIGKDKGERVKDKKTKREKRHLFAFWDTTPFFFSNFC